MAAWAFSNVLRRPFCISTSRNFRHNKRKAGLRVELKLLKSLSLKKYNLYHYRNATVKIFHVLALKWLAKANISTSSGCKSGSKTAGLQAAPAIGKAYHIDG